MIDKTPQKLVKHDFSQFNYLRPEIILYLQIFVKPIGFSPMEYQKLTRSNHPFLFQLLEDLGFFQFHYTNKKKSLIYVHQVQSFIKRNGGYYLYHQKGIVCGKGEMECHHLDNNPSNNSQNNLKYVTPKENKLLSYLVRLAKRNLSKAYQEISRLARLFKTGKDFQELANLTIFANAKKAWKFVEVWTLENSNYYSEIDQLQLALN
jgi:hypothetical protein